MSRKVQVRSSALVLSCCLLAGVLVPASSTAGRHAAVPGPQVLTKQAKALALAHPLVRGLLRGRTYSIHAEQWRVCVDGHPFGAVVQVQLRKPVSVDGSFPLWVTDRKPTRGTSLAW